MTTMRFGPFVWPVNPTEIRVEGGRSTREALFPSPSLQEEGEKLSRVTGRGVFTGPDAAAQFSALHALLETGGAEKARWRAPLPPVGSRRPCSKKAKRSGTSRRALPSPLSSFSRSILRFQSHGAQRPAQR